MRLIMLGAAVFCLGSWLTGCGNSYEIIAHRGASGWAPENTLPAIERALESGCGWVEFDIYLSADDVIVLMHDDTVDRTTDGKGQVSELTLTELRKLDAGSWYGEEFAGTQVPTLAEVIALTKGKIKLDIELKTGDVRIVAKTIKMVREAGMVEEVIFSSFHHGHLAEARKLDSAFKLGPLFGARQGKELGPEGVLEAARQLGADYVIMSYGTFDEAHPLDAYVEAVHGDGRKLWLYTIPEDKISYYGAKGVDGIITNYP